MPHWTEDLWVDEPELFVGQLEARFEQAPEQVDAVLSLLAAEYDLDGQLYVETREYEPETSRIHTVVRVLDEQGEEYRGSFSFDLRLYAPAELATMLERAGFRDVRLYASLDGDDLTRDSSQMIVLGRRG